MKQSNNESLELSEKEVKRSSELRKDIDKEIGFTEKQNKVLDNLKPIKIYKDILGKKITKIEWLQKRRTELFVQVFNSDMEEKDITPDLRSMFSGKMIKGLTFKKAIEIATPKKEIKITAKIVEVKEKKKEGFWNSQKHIWKSAFTMSKSNKTCIYCNHTFSSKKKLKKHMKKENKMQMKKAKREKKAMKKFGQKLKSQNIKNDKVKSLIWKERNLAYYKDQDGDYRRSRRGSYHGNGLKGGMYG